jgi:hypothetical protein
MLAKTLQKELVCWPHTTARGAVSEARIIEPGEKVFVRDNTEKIGRARIAVLVGGEILFCDRDQFWSSTK